MPRINEYQSRVGASGPMGGARMSPSDISTGRALRGLGQEIAGAGDQYAQFQERKEVFEAQKLAITENSEAKVLFEQMKQSAPPGAKDFTTQAKEELEKRRSQKLEQTEFNSPRARQVFEMRLGEIHAGLTDDALRFEAESQARETATFLKDAADLNNNMVRANPAEISKVLKNEEELIRSNPFLDQQRTEAYLTERKTALWDSALDGSVSAAETNPNTGIPRVNQMIADMKNEKSSWMGNTSPAQYDRALTRLERLKETITVKQQQFMVTDFEERMDQVRTTGIDQGFYTKDWINSNVSDPLLKAKMLKQESISRAVGEQVAWVREAPDSEIAARIRDMTDINKLGQSQTFSKDAATASAAQQAFERRMQAWDKDPAGYTLQVSETARGMYQKMRENPSPEAAAAYAETVIAEQAKLSPGSSPSLIPADLAGQIQAQMAAVPQNPDGAGQAVATLQQQQAMWGKNWPIAVKDLKNAKALNDSQYVAASMLDKPESKHIAEDLLRASLMKDEDLARQIPIEGATRAAREAAVSALAPFKRTTETMADGMQISTAYENALTKMILFKGAWAGDDMSSLADELAEQIITGSYEFTDTYRIPVNQNISAVKRGASLATTQIPQMDLVLPQSAAGLRDPDVKKRYVNRLKSQGRLVNNNDNGLRMVDEFGNQVFKKEAGKAVPLAWSWSELQALEIENASALGLTSSESGQ